jgi:hypothetical protein
VPAPQGCAVDAMAATATDWRCSIWRRDAPVKPVFPRFHRPKVSVTKRVAKSSLKYVEHKKFGMNNFWNKNILNNVTK